MVKKAKRAKAKKRIVSIPEKLLLDLNRRVLDLELEDEVKRLRSLARAETSETLWGRADLLARLLYNLLQTLRMSQPLPTLPNENKLDEWINTLKDDAADG